MKVFIGYDTREIEAFDVCKHSITRHATECAEIIPIKQSLLRKEGVYTREYEEIDGIKYDRIDGKPFSTEFSFTRFLVPYLSGYTGWSLFMDCDMLVTRDIKEVFDLADPKYAVMCVKHEYTPDTGTKMDGQIQQPYPRKNWSSFVLFNCARNYQLTPDLVNNAKGAFLHGFRWLEDEQIGPLPMEWNWLEGHNKPANIHYTRGGPWFDDYRNVEYADEWLAERNLIQMEAGHK